MKSNIKKDYHFSSSVLACLLMLSVIFMPSNAMAVGNSDSANGNSNSDSANQSSSTKLEAVKLQACENRAAAIGNVMNRVANRSMERLMFFDQVLEKVKALYNDKGLSIDNYSQLETVATQARIAVQASVQSEQTFATSFSCEGNDPKGHVEQFRNEVKTELKAMSKYRESIKEMIGAIKVSLTSSTEGDK